jgi:hypothetical protein
MARLACIALALSAAFVSTAVAADCVSDRQNLVGDANCSFDRDAAGWRPVDGGGTAVHDAKEGHPRAGALRVDGGASGSVTVDGPCLAARPGTYEVGGSIRTASGTPYFSPSTSTSTPTRAASRTRARWPLPAARRTRTGRRPPHRV